jgi:predicted dehydrogenase
MKQFTRRSFVKSVMAGAGLAALGGSAKAANEEVIQGFEETESNTDSAKEWTPVSDRKIRVGIVGYGVCQFGASFGFQHHPNVEVVAVSDLVPERCQALAKACSCEKTYPSLEELIKDPAIEAVFVATDAPSHARHCIETLKHGKHVATAVPAAFGSIEEAEELYEVVKASTGLHYMMFETSAYHNEAYAMRKLFNAGHFGTMVYSEGEYYHYMDTPIDSFKGWRVGLPPQWYPTHSNAYYNCITGGSFTEVSCMGIPSIIPHLKPENNPYQNPFGTEIALMRTSEGGMARMAVSWDTPGHHGEMGRVRGEKGAMTGMNFDGIVDISKLNLAKPPLPPTVAAGGHGGSHGYLTEEFITALLQDRKPLIDIAWSLNMTVAGIVSHQSALKDGELMKIPQYSF